MLKDYFKWFRTQEEIGFDLESKYRIKERDLSNIKFENIDLSRLRMNNKIIKNSTFVNCNMNNIDFKDTIFEDCTFQNSNLDGADFKNTTLVNCKFENLSMLNTKMYNVKHIKNNTFENNNVEVKLTKHWMTGLHTLDVINLKQDSDYDFDNVVDNMF